MVRFNKLDESLVLQTWPPGIILELFNITFFTEKKKKKNLNPTEGFVYKFQNTQPNSTNYRVEEYHELLCFGDPTGYPA